MNYFAIYKCTALLLENKHKKNIYIYLKLKKTLKMDLMTAQTLYYTMYGKCKTIHGTPTVDEIMDTSLPILDKKKEHSFFHKLLWSG